MGRPFAMVYVITFRFTSATTLMPRSLPIMEGFYRTLTAYYYDRLFRPSTLGKASFSMTACFRHRRRRLLLLIVLPKGLVTPITRLVRMMGLEPIRLATGDFKSPMSAIPSHPHPHITGVLTIVPFGNHLHHQALTRPAGFEP